LLVVEEAIVLVDDVPQSLQIALWGVFVLLFVYTGGA
jgi:hypothetical protein